MRADVPDGPEAVVGVFNELLQRGVIRGVVIFKTVQDFAGGEIAAVDWKAGFDQAADEADPGIGSGGWFEGAVCLVRPVSLQNAGVDVICGPVQVNVAAGVEGMKEGGSVIRRGGKEVVHVAVLHLLQVWERAGVAEIVGIEAAAVGGVEDQGQGRVGVFKDKGLFRFLQIQGENPCCLSLRSLLLLRA